MFSLTYASSATRPYSEAELAEILRVSRANNARLGVTGLLLYHDGNVMQVLEGEEKNVRQIYDKILRDERHAGCLLLLEEEIEERAFPDWHMGLRTINDSELRSLEGFSEAMEVDQDLNISRRTTQLLLENFKRMLA
ncbi:MAG: BLUF domain-containing protein [Pseudomonadales bacterium]|jgi:hypothetical protein